MKWAVNGWGLSVVMVSLCTSCGFRMINQHEMPPEELPAPLMLQSGAYDIESGMVPQDYAWLHYKIRGNPHAVEADLETVVASSRWEMIEASWLGVWLPWREFNHELGEEICGDTLKAIWKDASTGEVYTYSVRYQHESCAHEVVGKCESSIIRIDQVLYSPETGDDVVSKARDWNPEFATPSVPGATK